MKKGTLIFAISLFMITLLFSGCSTNKKLSCTQTSSGVDITFNVGFKGNTINSMDFAYDMDLSSYTDEQISYLKNMDFCSTVKSSVSDYKDAFVDCKQNIENKQLKVTSKLDVDKIAKNTLSKIKSVNSAKKELESQGFKCTIK